MLYVMIRIVYWTQIYGKFHHRLDRQTELLDGVEKSLATMSTSKRDSIFFEKTICLPLIANSMGCLRDIKSDLQL